MPESPSLCPQLTPRRYERAPSSEQRQGSGEDSFAVSKLRLSSKSEAAFVGLRKGSFRDDKGP